MAGKIGFLGWVLCGVALFSDLSAKGDVESEMWLLRQDFVKFGKKEAYEAHKKEYFQAYAKFVKKSVVFPCYAMQVLDSPQYIYLTSVDSYSGVDRLVKQKGDFMESYSSQDWDARMLARASTINFFFKSLQKFLPQASCIPKGKESLLAYPNVHFYWIGITPGQEVPFEQHLQAMAARKLQDETPVCWRVWRETVGSALPRYMIAVFGMSEKEADDNAEDLEFVSGPIKQIVRKQNQAKAVLRFDLSLL